MHVGRHHRAADGDLAMPPANHLRFPRRPPTTLEFACVIGSHRAQAWYATAMGRENAVGPTNRPSHAPQNMPCSDGKRNDPFPPWSLGSGLCLRCVAGGCVWRSFLPWMDYAVLLANMFGALFCHKLDRAVFLPPLPLLPLLPQNEGGGGRGGGASPLWNGSAARELFP